MKNNKILHITTAHKNDDVRIFHKEIKSLKKAGFNISLISQGDSDQIIDGINIYSVPFSKNRIDRFLITNLKILFRVIKINPKICHFHDPDFIFPAMILRLLGKKIIYDIHEDVPRQILSKFWIPIVFRKLISNLVAFLEFISTRIFFSWIIAATPLIASRFPRNKTETIMNYPKLSEFHNDSSYQIKETSLIYIGALGVTRGINELIEAFSNISNKSVKLYLAGSFESEKIKEITLEKIKNKNIEYLGFLNRIDVEKYLSKTKIGVVVLQPTESYIDSYPTKLFEYMAMGLPVIGSNFPIWEEIIKKNNCGLTVDPLNPEEFSNAIDWLLDNPIEAQKMGDRGRKAVYSKYNWNVEENKLINSYKGIL